MGFLAPWFLAGIVAAGIPVWLHLLKRYRQTPQPFSSLMFFERRVQSSVKHRRLRYLLLLALRLALLILLAMAFANPFVNRTSAMATRRKLTIVAIDRSFSMRYGDNMERAKAEAHRVINRLRGRDLSEVLAFDSRVEALTQPETDRSVLHAAIDSVHANDQASSFGEFARALRVLGQNTGMRLDAHLISDLQQTSMPPSFADLKMGSHTALELHCIGQKDEPNWAVEAVNAPEHVYDPAHTRIVATISGWETPETSRKVSLALDGQVIASKQVSVPGNGRAQVEFVSFNVPYGEHRGEVRIEPHDDLPADDVFPFSIERSDPREILFLYRSSRAREPFYYKAAMESVSDTGLRVHAEPVERSSVDDFSKYAFIVLGDVGVLDPTLDQKLGAYVRHGGSLLVSVGPNTADAGHLPVTGDRITATEGMQNAGLVDNQDPALLGVGRLENVHFSDTAQLSTTPSSRVAARFADGSPLITEENRGEGHVLTFASTLDNAMNDFCLHPSYLPFVVQTARYLAHSEDSPPAVVTGTPIQLRRTRDERSAADVIGPDGKHELSLSDASSALTFRVEREGFYQVQRADGRRMLVAAHADRRESDLTRVPDETLALWRNTGDTAAQAETGMVERQIRPWGLWRYVIIVVLVIAVIESVFANRYLKEESKA